MNISYRVYIASYLSYEWKRVIPASANQEEDERGGPMGNRQPARLSSAKLQRSAGSTSGCRQGDSSISVAGGPRQLILVLEMRIQFLQEYIPGGEVKVSRKF